MGIRLRSLDTPDVYQEGTERSSNQHHPRAAVHRGTAGCGNVVTTIEWFVAPEPADELNRQRHIDRDGKQLEDDTTQHDPSTLLGIFVVRGRDRRKGSADTLDS